MAFYRSSLLNPTGTNDLTPHIGKAQVRGLVSKDSPLPATMAALAGKFTYADGIFVRGSP